MANKLKDRTGQVRINNEGYQMMVIKYTNATDMIVEFEDKATTRAAWKEFDKGSVRHPNTIKSRHNAYGYNHQGCEMKVIKYVTAQEVYIEFQDNFKTIVKADWTRFENGGIDNPCYPSVFGKGIPGNKYSYSVNGKKTKEYHTWCGMLERCFTSNDNKNHTYQQCEVCEEWLYYPNFHEWLHSQENFEQWKSMKRSAIDKDILIKGNKVYSPETCCLVPDNVNIILIKNDMNRGDCLIGVTKNKNGTYLSQCRDPFIRKNVHLGNYSNEYDAYIAYKKYKEALIKQVAKIEYQNGNITKTCYEAMLRYEVEITD